MTTKANEKWVCKEERRNKHCVTKSAMPRYHGITIQDHPKRFAILGSPSGATKHHKQKEQTKRTLFVHIKRSWYSSSLFLAICTIRQSKLLYIPSPCSPLLLCFNAGSNLLPKLLSIVVSKMSMALATIWMKRRHKLSLIWPMPV